MTLHRFLRLWTFLALAACAALLIHTARQRTRLREARETDLARQSAFDRERATLTSQLATLDAELSRLTAELTPPVSTKPRPRTRRELSDLDTRQRDARRQRDPAEGEWHRNFYRRMVHMNYSDLLERLSLTPDQLTRFKQLLAEKMMTTADAHTVAIVQGQSSDSRLAREAAKQAEADLDREIHALLGDDNFAEYQEHERTFTETFRTREFNAALSEKNLPLLTPGQIRALASACCDVEDPARNPQHAAISKNSLGSVATEQILQRLGTTLTPTQAQAFAAYRAEKNAARAASQKLVRGE